VALTVTLTLTLTLVLTLTPTPTLVLLNVGPVGFRCWRIRFLIGNFHTEDDIKKVNHIDGTVINWTKLLTWIKIGPFWKQFS